MKVREDERGRIGTHESPRGRARVKAWEDKVCVKALKDVRASKHGRTGTSQSAGGWVRIKAGEDKVRIKAREDKCSSSIGG
ncbi:hypothetical protein AMTR_s00006p00237030 [Amborella trichopoda]|uniref:Uncharacterized protein n=1 Tax=Amborella trichopoda TaxID=13333 RepID=W1PF84_AMBTC|nr:hypothetical protein AMTR_s00006p00237030 [Amborella trichopoda]